MKESELAVLEIELADSPGKSAPACMKLIQDYRAMRAEYLSLLQLAQAYEIYLRRFANISPDLPNHHISGEMQVAWKLWKKTCQEVSEGLPK